jgi:hypothetical protein
LVIVTLQELQPHLLLDLYFTQENDKARGTKVKYAQAHMGEWKIKYTLVLAAATPFFPPAGVELYIENNGGGIR